MSDTDHISPTFSPMCLPKVRGIWYTEFAGEKCSHRSLIYRKEFSISMKKTSPATSDVEKAHGRYIFACVANILYIAPCIMCLAFGILSDGFSTPFLIAIITALFAAPVSFTGLYCYKKHRGRSVLLLLCLVLLICHVISAFYVTTWYLILAPAFVLTLVLMASSRVI